MDFLTRAIKLPRLVKRAVLFALDLGLIALALSIAVVLQNTILSPSFALGRAGILFALLLPVGAAIVLALRLPQIKVSSLDTNAVERIAIAGAGLTLTSFGLNYLFTLKLTLATPIVFGMTFFVTALLVRLLGMTLITKLLDRKNTRIPVAIYGAGAAGTQLAFALRQSRVFRPVFFVDDNPNISGLVISGLPVHLPRQLHRLVEKHQIKRVLLAMPSIDIKHQSSILVGLQNLGVDVRVLPSYSDLILTEKTLDKLKPFNPDQILGRDKVALDIPEIASAYKGKVVMVTGAGGSIGSELCRQLLDCAPEKIVLFEQSEYHLYAIDMELGPEAQSTGTVLATCLGSVTNKSRVGEVVRAQGVEIILHAAAYKHVPLVEKNETEGAHNNVIGTQVVAEVAMENQVERFILVSTDKAVRPANIMGASKRMAELVVQDLQTRSASTLFSLVRFGNVLGSSGSVLPLFQKQLQHGGPLTVTHPAVTRFFMTIPEAARLVLLAGAFSEGGDVFVLDMGRPRKVMDIARQVIQLSGRRVKNLETGEGDIEIKIVGLRPGEKLYEELLIDDKSLRGTPHPKIFRAEEGFLSQIQTAAMLRDVRKTIADADGVELREVTRHYVNGFAEQGVQMAASVGDKPA